jgi:hypothetical protein
VVKAAMVFAQNTPKFRRFLPKIGCDEIIGLPGPRATATIDSLDRTILPGMVFFLLEYSRDYRRSPRI